MNTLDRIVVGLLKPVNPYATSLLGILTAAWGLWVINPFWQVFGHAALFNKMHQFAPEWAWGAWATTCGALIIFSIFTGRYRVLIGAMAFAIWHWGTVSIFMWWGDWENTGGITYSCITIYCAYIYLNVKINLEHGDHF